MNVFWTLISDNYMYPYFPNFRKLEKLNMQNWNVHIIPHMVVVVTEIGIQAGPFSRFRWLWTQANPKFKIFIFSGFPVGDYNWRGGAWNSVNVFRRYLLQNQGSSGVFRLCWEYDAVISCSFCWLLQLISIIYYLLNFWTYWCIDCWTLEWI